MPTRRFAPLKRVLAILWLLLLAAVLLWWWRSPLALVEVPSLLHLWLGDFGLLRAALIYVLLYALRPLVLFPSTLLTVASGLIFGPWLGILFTIAGENVSANVAFLLARWFGRGAVAAHEHGVVRRWEEMLCRNGVVTVMVLRLIYLPFDPVNFGCGLTGMRQRDYAIGTFFGILPGIVTFVLLGGAAAAGVDNRLTVLGLSLFFFLLGLAVARWLRRRDVRAARRSPSC